MTCDPSKGRAALRHGRWTKSGAYYFLTICTGDKKSGLTDSEIAISIMLEMCAMESDRSWQVQCATIMPDHMHILITLGYRLTLGRTLQRLKSKTAANLRLSGLTWERDVFDRQLRPDDDRLAVFLYIYLNPYRAKLCRPDERWPWYYCRSEDWDWFQNYLDCDLPPPAWLDR